MYRVLPIFILAIFTLGVSPCDLIQQPDQMVDAGDSGVVCGEEICVNSLVIEAIRADNESFYQGIFNFWVIIPEVAEYSLECLYGGYGTSLDCAYGDLGILGAYMDGNGKIITLTLLDAPTSATFVVKYNDWKIGERTFTPNYEEVLPNGPQCLPVCYQAEETMAVESW